MGSDAEKARGGRIWWVGAGAGRWRSSMGSSGSCRCLKKRTERAIQQGSRGRNQREMPGGEDGIRPDPTRGAGPRAIQRWRGEERSGAAASWGDEEELLSSWSSWTGATGAQARLDGVLLVTLGWRRPWEELGGAGPRGHSNRAADGGNRAVTWR